MQGEPSLALIHDLLAVPVWTVCDAVCMAASKCKIAFKLHQHPGCACCDMVSHALTATDTAGCFTTAFALKPTCRD